MCGIAGILDFRGRAVDQVAVRAMMDRLAHRGPDDAGVWVREPVGFGHRRLSIIDLAGGHQPMISPSGEVAVSYNGEIYNYRELAAELSKCGHTFRTSSDTEVVLHAWQQWGAACVERFRGMFAFAIADFRQQQLFLARDHLGIKPLFYTSSADRFAFASELQSLRVVPGRSDDIDPQAVDRFLFLHYIPAPRTIYRNVFKLAPGHRLTVGFDGSVSEPEAYWSLNFTAREGRTIEEWEAQLESILRDSVRAHLVADVPFGAFLSGGIDSTAIVGLMSEELSEPVQTFCIGFDEQDFSEVEYARQVARYWKTDHHEEIVRPDALDVLPQLVRHYGEPFGDSSAIPTYYVSRLARRHVPMVLTGDGGDEALLGYGRYASWRKWVNPGLPQRPMWKQAMRPALARLSPSRFPADSATRPAHMPDWLGWTSGKRLAEREHLWRTEFRDTLTDDVNEFRDIGRRAAVVPPEQFGQYVDYHTYLPHDVLTKVDIASMCHGLETRTPIVDVRVAEFAATIPWTMNLRQHENGQWTGKHLLKRIVARHFGNDFVERKKTGFSVPLKHWFREQGALKNELCDRFLIGEAQIYQYFHRPAVELLIGEHGEQERDHSQMLWQLLFLENWLEQHTAAQQTAVMEPVQ